MINYLTTFKEWYEFRQMREKILVVALSWVLLYSIFSLCFFTPLGQKKSLLLNDIKTLNNQVASWNTQLTALKKIPNTPLYQDWLRHNHSLTRLEQQYKYLLQTSPTIQMQKVIKTILEPQPGITLTQIKNIPEKTYTPKVLDTNIANRIYEQELVIVIYGQYFDILNYFAYLEKTLPTIYWDNVEYQVVKYPIAKVQMEISILYEKK